MPEEFVAVKPRVGQWLVSLDRERVYGQVSSVSKNGTFQWGAVASTLTWEEVQYLRGRCRFVDDVPEGFTEEGNGWSPRSKR